ncbi:hypothetical protein AVEN_247631-1 [Araneus ventricosus]|uniref:Uncharacterized protein n=1 Tax=Araneus ventricosus TaxID=182803 RepID=A0A4Y2FWF0_ARAVE|nr:hypothetical protein AVEN_247631-1 [Araneus ventricosus]
MDEPPLLFSAERFPIPGLNYSTPSILPVPATGTDASLSKPQPDMPFRTSQSVRTIPRYLPYHLNHPFAQVSLNVKPSGVVSPKLSRILLEKGAVSPPPG